MKKQVQYDVVQNDNKINITKNTQIIFSISVIDKSINLKELYEKMNVQLDEELHLNPALTQKQNPTNDSDRIYNNVIEFFSRLVDALNNKLMSLSDIDNNDSF